MSHLFAFALGIFSVVLIQAIARALTSDDPLDAVVHATRMRALGQPPRASINTDRAIVDGGGTINDEMLEALQRSLALALQQQKDGASFEEWAEFIDDARVAVAKAGGGL